MISFRTRFEINTCAVYLSNRVKCKVHDQRKKLAWEEHKRDFLSRLGGENRLSTHTLRTFKRFTPCGSTVQFCTTCSVHILLLDISSSPWSHSPTRAHTAPFSGFKISHTHTHTVTHSVGLLWTSDQLVVKAATCTAHIKHKKANIYVLSEIRAHDPKNRTAADLILRSHGRRNRHASWRNRS